VFCFLQHEFCSIPILDVGRMNHYGEYQPEDVDEQMALATGYLFPCVVTARPPFSVVFTD